jgi:lipopolysaccharide export system protein LptC
MSKPHRLTELKFKTDRKNAEQGAHIRHLRFGLPIIAIIMTIATIVWTLNSGDTITSHINDVAIEAIAKNELINPRFDSVDSKNQPYTITAASAVRNEADENIIILTEPAADITLKSGRWIAINAEKGDFNQKENNLDLQNTVEIHDNVGYTLKTNTMSINMKTETILAQSSIRAQGPAGTIYAAAMQGDMQAGILSFKGPATLTLTSSTEKIGGLR